MTAPSATAFDLDRYGSCSKRTRQRERKVRSISRAVLDERKVTFR